MVPYSQAACICLYDENPSSMHIGSDTGQFAAQALAFSPYPPPVPLSLLLGVIEASGTEETWDSNWKRNG